MEQKELEQLKTIPVFMGYTYYGHNDPRLVDPLQPRITYAPGWKKFAITRMSIVGDYNYLCRKHEMLASYKHNWNWLMPVVEKIESLGFKFQICRRRVEIADDTNQQRLWLVIKSEKDKMDAIYRAVLEFIKWYNKPKKS